MAVFSLSNTLAEAETAQILESYGKIPLAFTVNEGQLDGQVKFTTTGSGCDMFFTATGTTFLLSRETTSSAAKRVARTSVADGQKSEIEQEAFAVKVSFLNANTNPEVSGEDRLGWNTNYFIGSDQSKWRTDVPNYGKIRLKEVYDGVDLVYYGNKNRIKYDFVVKPGEDPSKITLAYDLGENDGNALSINVSGELVVKTPLGDVIERTPYCYQTIGGKTVAVPVSYRIIDAAANTFGFEIGAYSQEYDLCIDPELVYSTFLGASGEDYGYGIAVDGSGDAYVAGWTGSSGFPMTSGSYDTGLGGTWDAFVTKLNANGTGLVYSTFLGGSSIDTGLAIAVDDFGNAYVTGNTYSSGFPVTSGAFDASWNGDYDAFVTKLNASGNALLYSLFLGGAAKDEGYGIAVDNSGNAYVTGGTLSPGYPVTSGAFDTSRNSTNSTYTDAFVTKVNADGTGLVYSTFLGGTAQDEGYGIAVDSAENAYVAGRTYASDYPATSGAYDTVFNGVYDAFVAKLNASGAGLVYSTFLGGGDNDHAYGIAVDNSGNAYVTGYTYGSGYPVTSGAYDESANSGNDVFVTKLNASGTGLAYSTFLGGIGNECGRAIGVDNSGNAYVTGETKSPGYPVTSGAYDESANSGDDAFVTKLNASGTGLAYSTFLGGSSADRGSALAVDGSGNVYVAGYTQSSSYPVTSGTYDTSQNSGRDTFVTKLNTGSGSAVDEAVPATFTVSPPYPNPFNPSTAITVRIPQSAPVRVAMYNVLGQEVRVLHNGMMSVGAHTLVWDGRNNAGKIAASGVYFYSVKVGAYSAQGKVMFLR